MTGFPELRSEEAEGTRCLLESPRFLGCVLACTFGWGWIGTWRTRPAPALCRCGGTLALGLRNNSGCICEPKRRNDEGEENRAVDAAGLRAGTGSAGANQAHRNAR